MSGKWKKTDKYSNYVEHLLVFVSTVIGYVSISAFASLVCVTVGIPSSGVRIKVVQSLQELIIMSHLSKKRRKSWSNSVVKKN